MIGLPMILEFLASQLGRMVIGGVALLGLFGMYSWHERDVGAKSATAKIEQVTNHAAQIGKSAAAKSQRNAAGGVRIGQRDATPYDN